MTRARWGQVLLSALMIFLVHTRSDAAIRVGSKNFTEGFLLGELVAQTLEEDKTVAVERRLGLGATGIAFEALKNQEVDVYIEYTGTLSETILKQPELNRYEDLVNELAKIGVVISRPLGFNNTYALAVRRDFSERYEVRKLSDLEKVQSQARFGFSYEFMSRNDGYRALLRHYGWTIPGDHVKSMEHSLLYPAIQNHEVEVIEIYSTDGKLGQLDLVVLEDDRAFFPRYDAVMVTTSSFVKDHSALWNDLCAKLEGRIDEPTMVRLNSEVDHEKKSYSTVIARYLNRSTSSPLASDLGPRLRRRTIEHLFLVGVSLLACLIVGLPLGVLASTSRGLGQGILLVASVVQTIPSLALLCFLIPVFGIGRAPALFALFLYGLLPIVLNTFTALRTMDPAYRNTAKGLGLSRWQRLWLIELPLASPQILAGIKTSVIIGIGTATLAALIGAGGYGVMIVTGLAMNDIPTILIGAVPAAVMALSAHLLFDLLGRWIVPRGLRIRSGV